MYLTPFLSRQISLRTEKTPGYHYPKSVQIFSTPQIQNIPSLSPIYE
ncbi:MAG: hypothetical protein QG640_474 [Patescibacteria group bacterium]|nr:hypothetical protein [Patescibacteria group bacterium]